MAEELSPELRELKRQTRIMAEKEATRAASGGLLIGVLIVVGLLYANAKALPVWAVIAIPVVIGVLAYRGAYKRHTEG
jgi:hypothetical protein